MTARAEKKAPAKERPLSPHPVPVPRGRKRYSYWGSGAIGTKLEKERRQSGYTSCRLSKATLALLRRVEQLSQCNGLDELLYFDALQRLGELPEEIVAQERELRRSGRVP